MRLVIGAAIYIALAVPSAFAQDAGYVGQQGREIKALSAQDQSDLVAGRGMGLAKAGELNHYPGPAHVIDLREKLALTRQQLEAVRASFEHMGTLAKPLGAEIIKRERDLDLAFRNGTVSNATLATQIAEVADIEGRLRAVHLSAHLEMRSVLTPQQIATYDKLRGYTDTTTVPSPGGHAGMHPG